MMEEDRVMMTECWVRKLVMMIYSMAVAFLDLDFNWCMAERKGLSSVRAD